MVSIKDATNVQVLNVQLDRALTRRAQRCVTVASGFFNTYDSHLERKHETKINRNTSNRIGNRKMRNTLVIVAL